MEVKDRIAMKVADAVQASGLGKSTLYEAMQAGELRYIKIGAARLIKRDDLEAFIDRHRVEAA
jgi:excisionase family DNA binding protein